MLNKKYISKRNNKNHEEQGQATKDIIIISQVT